MMRTESEAKQIMCPEMMKANATFHLAAWVTNFGPQIDGKAFVSSLDDHLGRATCWGTGCMHWRWGGPRLSAVSGGEPADQSLRRGYCGLSGKPGFE